ncbi:transaldolase family protein [Christensenella intestinihominis]|uniref:transaldolase family protein n=1 Tax=Christensenella intestinihominis TaxID=1851429 RepID=UPI00082A15A3|nr:transaldolase family protein [Christensenella intestinihominis]
MDYRIFLDTADVKEIEDAVQTGIVDGIATNPNKMAQVGRKYEEVIRDIRSFFDGPVAVEAVTTKAEDIIEEAQRLSNLAKNMVIKIPTNKEGVKAISKLVPMGIVTNSTLICNPGQALVAGRAGSPFISPFINRVNAIGHNGMELFSEVRKIYDFYDIKSVVISASIKNCYDAVQSIIAGADAVAVTYEVFNQLFEHPLTQMGIESFTADYRAVNG